MKRQLLMLMVLVMASITAMAHDFAVANSEGMTIYYVKNADGTSVSVSNKDGDYTENAYSGVVVVPETVEYEGTTYTVTAIGDYGFYTCKNLIDVKMPNTITSIGENAFEACVHMSSVTLPESVTKIGYAAFTFCLELAEVTIPDSVTEVGANVFQDCEGLESVTFSQNMTEVSDYMFSGCTKLKRAEPGPKVLSIGEQAFSWCTGLEYVSISRYCESIGKSAFWECTGLKTLRFIANPVNVSKGEDYLSDVPVETCELQVPRGYENYVAANATLKQFKNVKSMPNWDFQETIDGVTYNYFFNYSQKSVSLTYDKFKDSYNVNSITIPLTAKYDGVSYIVAGIGDYAFCNSSIKSVTLTYHLQNIDFMAFANCENLTKVYLPYGVQKLSSGAFEECTNLTEVSIPKTVESVGLEAFDGCAKLAKIEVRATEPPAAGENCFRGIDVSSCKLYVPAESLTAYKSANNWKEFNSVNALPHYDFVKNDANGNPVYYLITNTNQVAVTYETTAYKSYSGSYTLNSLVPYEGVKYYTQSIGENAFNNCSGLTDITFPDVMFYDIEDNAFSYCTGLTKVDPKAALKTIGKESFSYCTNLKEISLYDKLTSIGESAFLSCSSLDNVVIPSSVTEIEENAFYYCTGITKVTVQNPDPTAITLGADVFQGVKVKEATLYVPEGSVDAYKESPQWKEFGTILGGSDTGVENVVTEEAGEKVFYDLMGRRVENPSRGLYIVNGKKVILK